MIGRDHLRVRGRTGTKAADSLGQKLMLRGNRETPHPGGGWARIVTMEQPDRYDSRRNRPVSFTIERYDGGLISDKWETPVHVPPAGLKHA